MKKVSVRSANKLHRPVFYGALPMNPPRPLCGLVGMGEDPQWSSLEHFCEACDRAFKYEDSMKSLELQIGMGL